METISKSEFARALAEKTNTSIREGSDLLNAVLELMSQKLSQGDTLDFSGFGKFEVRERPARNGRNPMTGEPMEIPASKNVKFTAKKALKEAVNHD